MLGIIELQAARCFKIIDPSQVMLIDEIGVKTKSDDDLISRISAQKAATCS